MEGWVTVHELAGVIGVSIGRIEYAESKGYLPEPQRWQGHKVYDFRAADEIRKYFQGRRPWTKHKEDGR